MRDLIDAAIERAATRNISNETLIRYLKIKWHISIDIEVLKKRYGNEVIKRNQ